MTAVPTDYRTAGGVVIRDGLVLVLDRPSRSEIRLPKGHIGPGETAEHAAVRETREETGYRDLRVVRDLGHMLVSFDLDGERVVRSERYFLMGLASGVTVSRPAGDAAQFRVLWLPPREALSRLTFDAERQWVRVALAADPDAAGGMAAPAPP